MRYLLIATMALFLAVPAFANDTVCRMDGPHNCNDQIDDQLDSITKNTVHAMNLAHPGHAFKTQNDIILEQASRNHASLGPDYAHPQVSANLSHF